MEQKERTGTLSYIIMAVAAFMAVWLEVIIVLLEPFIYGKNVEFSDWTIILHWILTCAAWSTAAFFLLKYAITHCGFKLKESTENPILWRLLIIAVLFSLSVFISYKAWNGFKILIEFKNLGILKFFIQYLYYFIETVLFVLIIAFAQKAFELQFKTAKVPFGGIFCAATWGLTHIVTQSSVAVGLLAASDALFFGTVYLLLNKDFFKSLPVIFLMFVV